MENRIFNTGETQEELNAKYNPDGSVLRQAQLRMLDMLIYIDKVCKEQNIPYRLDSGNVLGAIRHGGFIPWDDDVDIVLSRKDCKRLRKYLLNHPHPQYVLQTFNTDYGYVGAWDVLRDTKSEYLQNSIVHKPRKYRGLQIDIFSVENRIIKPFHSFSSHITSFNHTWFVGKYMFLARSIHWVQFNILHPVFRIVGVMIGNPNIYMYSYGSIFIEQHSMKTLLPYNELVFEGYTFSGPADPQLYCKETYGDSFMNLPSINKRNHHHTEIKIWS